MRQIPKIYFVIKIYMFRASSVPSRYLLMMGTEDVRNV
jgi:hypothetical protein